MLPTGHPSTKIIYPKLDVTNASDISAVAEQIRGLGGLDVLINSAGLSFETFGIKDQTEVMEKTLSLSTSVGTAFGLLSDAHRLLWRDGIDRRHVTSHARGRSNCHYVFVDFARLQIRQPRVAQASDGSKHDTAATRRPSQRVFGRLRLSRYDKGR